MPSSSVTVPREAWEDLLSNWEDDLQARFDEMKECWGGDEHVALWPKLLARMVADASDGCMEEMDVNVLVDNFLVNGEIVERGEFTETGNWQYYYTKYSGDWERCCEDAIVYDDKCALMRF